MFQFNRLRTAAPAVLCAALLLAIATPISAQGDFLASLDLDGDGVVTVPEATRARNASFPEVDGDGDGRLSPEEFDALLQGARDRYQGLGQHYHAREASPGRLDAFTFSDSDADGYVSLAEFERTSARFSRSLDRDGDGVISPMDFVR